MYEVCTQNVQAWMCLIDRFTSLTVLQRCVGSIEEAQDMIPEQGLGIKARHMLHLAEWSGTMNVTKLQDGNVLPKTEAPSCTSSASPGRQPTTHHEHMFRELGTEHNNSKHENAVHKGISRRVFKHFHFSYHHTPILAFSYHLLLSAFSSPPAPLIVLVLCTHHISMLKSAHLLGMPIHRVLVGLMT